MNNGFGESKKYIIPYQRSNKKHPMRSLIPVKVGFNGIGQDDSFYCLHCKQLVTANSRFSGVNNRNHCPVCLHSRHLDHFTPGDRLSSCMAEMAPLALTIKQSYKKYGSPDGELMLVHRCTGCGKLSINRIAADDDADTLWRVYERSWELCQCDRIAMIRAGISPLILEQRQLVTVRLFGKIVAEEGMITN